MTHDEIVAILVEYIMQTNPFARESGPLPLDESLYDVGILDSAGIIELVSFIENRWSIAIFDSELTKEDFGGIHKMATLIAAKTAR